MYTHSLLGLFPQPDIQCCSKSSYESMKFSHSHICLNLFYNIDKNLENITIFTINEIYVEEIIEYKL